MVAYCNNCRRYVNQYCEICSGNFGVKVCERYGCGGRMLCPICGGNNLSKKRQYDADPFDFSKEQIKQKVRKGAASEIEARYFVEQKMKEKGGASSTASPAKERHCPLCGYKLQEGWKFCPECGVSLLKK